ncbi:hypothetical protein [Virgibacillus sp. DJP39]|uniref:hypothetical protein n=1 Tax=Virgibacillus sp. DJP39 TaxID=3409790 RepID=UPI003BB76604
MREAIISDVQVNIVNVKILQISGTSAFIIGKGELSDFSSESKTNNGVGNAYGDGSDIEMRPDNLILNDPEFIESIDDKTKVYSSREVKNTFQEDPNLWGWVSSNQKEGYR